MSPATAAAGDAEVIRSRRRRRRSVLLVNEGGHELKHPHIITPFQVTRTDNPIGKVPGRLRNCSAQRNTQPGPAVNPRIARPTSPARKDRVSEGGRLIVRGPLVTTSMRRQGLSISRPAVRRCAGRHRCR